MTDRDEYTERIAALKETSRHIRRLLPKSERFPERDEFLDLLNTMVSVNLQRISECPAAN